MAMVAVVYWLPAGRIMAQVDLFGPKVGGHWRCFYSLRMNRVNSRSVLSTMSDSTIYIVRRPDFQKILSQTYDKILVKITLQHY